MWSSFCLLIFGCLLYCQSWLVRGEMYNGDPDVSNFEDEGYYPMLRSHWLKYRRMSPIVRSQMAIPIPRAGKRSDPALDYISPAGSISRSGMINFPGPEDSREKKLFLHTYGRNMPLWPIRPNMF